MSHTTVALVASAGAASAEDLKIALIRGLTGPLQAYAKQTETGFMMGLEYATKGTMEVDGRKIVIITKDDQGKPDLAKSALAEAYEDDDADIAVGTTSSAAAIAMLPVAEEHKVRLCCHPHDPGLPGGKPYRGVHRVLGSVEGLKRFAEISASKYHGLNFCQGTVAEMLEKPGKEIYDVIRHFGKQGKIFNVHFRNIKGGLGNFSETFPDAGDVDMLKALRVYREVGYDGMIMPDHVPQIDGDEASAQAFAFAFGYIQALLQVVNGEP